MILFKRFIVLSCISVLVAFQVYTEDVLYLLPKGSYIFSEEDVFSFDSVPREKQGEMIYDDLSVFYREGNAYYSGGIKDTPDTITVLDGQGNQFTVLASDVERDNLSSPALKKMSKSYWISSYYYDVLKSQDKNILFDKEKGWIKSWSPSTDEKLSEIILPTLFYLTENLVYIFSYSAFGTTFLIESDSEFEQSILLNCYLYPDPLNDRYKFWDEDDFIRKINDKEHVSLRMTFDGDYMKLYEGSSNELLETFARIRKDDYKIVTNKLQQIVGDKEILMDDIIFPRHADGTCDYDNANVSTTAVSDGIPDTSAEKAAVSKPAPAVGNPATVTESLRLRTSDQTTSQVIATLATGTRVKVLAHGREDTIDDITSNWMQVEVLGGAKDKDGNAVEMGTTGWLFGGYLSETEPTESERANKEAAEAKKSSALPIVPIAVGGAAFAVLLAAILLASKKKKAEKK